MNFKTDEWLDLELQYPCYYLESQQIYFRQLEIAASISWELQ